MATTEQFLSGTGATPLGFTTEYIKESDIKVRVNGGNPLTFTTSSSPTTGQYHIPTNGTTIKFGDTYGGSDEIHVYRETDFDNPLASFTAGSSIKAADLNLIHKAARFGGQEARQQIVTPDLRDGQVTSDKIKDATIVDADISGSAAIAQSKIATGTLPSGIQVNSANIVDGSIVDGDINASANIQGSKLANDSVALTKLGGGTLPSDITVTSTNIEDGTIVNADVNASAAIAGTKVTPDFGSQNVVTTGTLGSGNLTVGGTITVSGTVDGRDVASDGTKLDTIESGATADQTNAEIKTAYEANANTNVFTDAEKTKLTNIETGATADQTAGEIKTLYESNSDTNEFSDAEQSKLQGIETGATADQTNAEIKTAYEANANTNEFSDAEQSKLAGIETAATADQTAGEIKTLLQSDKLTLSEIDTSSTDSRYFTETELTNGALDGRYYTETEAEAKFLRQDSSETIASGATWSNSDAFVATTAAINARIIDLIDDVGGFTAITNQLSFPTTNPQGSTGQAAILSIGATTATLTPSSGTITIANGAGTGNTVTITGAPTIPQGFGFLVNSTSTLHTYTFHRLVPIATQVDTVATNITNIVNAGANVADINNFADKYIISSSEPTQRNDSTSLQEGDLWYDSSNDNLLVYTGSAFSIITPSQSVLDDVAIVSGAITYAEDLGLITDAASTGSSNGSLDIVADALEDEITFTVTVAGGKFYIDGVSAPALTLYKGWTYTFDVSDSSNGAHPLRFYAGSSQYSTGVTVTGSQGSAGAKVQIVIPESQPTNFQYYCTNHSGMGNSITVKDDPIKTVSDNVVKIIAAADNSTNINAVQANESNINAVQANASNINAAVSNASNINAAVANATNINTVAGNNSNVTTVAGKATEIGRLGTADAVADMNTLGTTAIVSDMDTLADISSNITTVAGVSSNVTTVAGISSNVTTVANNNSNVTSVANNSSNINSAVSNASNINTVAGSISNVNTTAGSINNVNTVAGSITDVNTFATRYRIGSTNPTTSLDVGDLFFNTSANELRIYNGTQWQGGVTATGNFATTAGVIFTGDNRYNDNIKAKYGNDSDLQIFHDSNDSIINASGVGNIKLQDQGNTKLEITSTGISTTGNISVSGTVDGRDVATDGSKLDGIESGATGDQTASEIVALVAGQTIAPNVITTTNLTLDFGTL